MPEIARGGRAIAGAAVGLLMLDTRFPRIPGDAGHMGTWPFPVLARVVRGATPARVVGDGAAGLVEAFVEAGRGVVADGAAGVVTNCGFMGLHQDRLAMALGVPVLTTSLMQVAQVNRLLAPGRRAGILTVSARSLTAAHLAAAGIPPGTPVASTEGGRTFTRVLLDDEPEMDIAAARADNLDAAADLVADRPDLGAIVLECTNMAPYAADIARATGLPVFSIVTAVSWFHAGLVPQRFAAP